MLTARIVVLRYLFVTKESHHVAEEKGVHPTIWGDELKKADMLVTPGVVFSGTTFQRRVQHVHRLIVS